MTTESDLLYGLAPSEAEAVLALGFERRLSSGDTLFELGAEADRLFLVRRGRLALTLPMQVYGQPREILVEERQAGQTVGWSALIPPHRFTLTAKAVIDTEVLEIAGRALLEHFASRPDTGYAVTRNVAAVVGQRLQVCQAMWVREMQRVVNLTHA
jgi:CRP/FNR family transcriptional regulator, cyclic AMP receptor protein